MSDEEKISAPAGENGSATMKTKPDAGGNAAWAYAEGKKICAESYEKLRRAIKARDAANRRVDRLSMAAVWRLSSLLRALEGEVRHE